MSMLWTLYSFLMYRYGYAFLSRHCLYCIPRILICCNFIIIHFKITFFIVTLSFFFFSFWLHSGIWKFLGQGSDLSHSSNLCHSCATLDPLTHCTGPWGHWRECHSPCTRLGMPAHLLFIEYLNIGQEGVKTGGLSSISLSFTGVERSRYSQTKKDSR